MGLIRGILVVLICVVFFVSLLTAGIFVTLSSSLSYENVQPEMTSIVTKVIQEQIGESNIVNTLLPYLGEYCQTNSEITEKFGGYTFVYPCDIVEQGQTKIISYSIEYLVEDFYYREYTCKFWSCLDESEIPLFLVSDYAKSYWRGWFLKSFLISLILAAGIVLLSRRKSRGFVVAGAIVLVSSFVVLQLNRIGSFVARMILSPLSSVSSKTSQSILSDVVGLFFSSSKAIFVWMIAVGFILIGIGIFLRLFRIGFKISNFFRRMEDNKNKSEEKPNKIKKK